VPGHTIFGIVMGFYLGLARFSTSNKTKWLANAFIVPWLLHGIYDFMLMSGHPVLLISFIPFLIFMYRYGLKKMRELNEQSVFNPINIGFTRFEDPNHRENN
jgi:RsiW-degrading membrane proteinase PrsW (M82 family)